MHKVAVQKARGENPDVFFASLDGADLEFIFMKQFWFLKSYVTCDTSDCDYDK